MFPLNANQEPGFFVYRTQFFGHRLTLRRPA